MSSTSCLLLSFASYLLTCVGCPLSQVWFQNLIFLFIFSCFSPYLHSKLKNIWFLPFQAFSLVDFSLSFCSFPSNQSPDESESPNRRIETNGFIRPFGQQWVRNLFTRPKWVKWQFDPKPDLLDQWRALMWIDFYFYYVLYIYIYIYTHTYVCMYVCMSILCAKINTLTIKIDWINLIIIFLTNKTITLIKNKFIISATKLKTNISFSGKNYFSIV